VVPVAVSRKLTTPRRRKVGSRLTDIDEPSFNNNRSPGVCAFLIEMSTRPGMAAFSPVIASAGHLLDLLECNAQQRICSSAASSSSFVADKKFCSGKKNDQVTFQKIIIDRGCCVRSMVIYAWKERLLHIALAASHFY
jgi:hypothetical protein